MGCEFAMTDSTVPEGTPGKVIEIVEVVSSDLRVQFTIKERDKIVRTSIRNTMNTYRIS
jgi:hypothetical protein